VCEATTPSTARLRRHGGHNLCGIGVGHCPKHALADNWMGDADDIRCDAGPRGGEDLSGLLGVELGDQRGEAGRVEVVHGRSWRRELYGMAPLGG
jgi:hypothetical protein